MKRTVQKVICCCLVLAGCKGGGPSGGQPAPPVAVRESEKVASPRAPGPYAIKKEKLEGFLEYQQALLGIYDVLLEELDRVDSDADGGKLGRAAVSASMRILENRARAEEQARKQAGLTEEDVREIELVVSAVINKRSMGKLFDANAAIKQWEEMRPKVPEDQRAGIDQTIADMKQQQEEAEKLTEERRRFGDANVDLVLSREEVLTRNQDAYLQKLTGGKR